MNNYRSDCYQEKKWTLKDEQDLDWNARSNT